MGRDGVEHADTHSQFQSTHPVWGGTWSVALPWRLSCDFNPPTPCGVGLSHSGLVQSSSLFQSTHPVWGGTVGGYNDPALCAISIHPPRVGWDKKHKTAAVIFKISIHPPRVGWDRKHYTLRLNSQISIHPPRVGWDLFPPGHCPGERHFNPPTPCGVGRVIAFLGHQFTQFQSTHPVWGGTRHRRPSYSGENISIHPPRVGWDDFRRSGYCRTPHFNPPTPCGVGPASPAVSL